VSTAPHDHPGEPPGSGTARPRGRDDRTAWVMTWAALTGLWLLLAGSLALAEVAAAAAASAVAATIGLYARRRADAPVLRGPGWLRHAPGVARQALVDCWIVSRAVVSRIFGRGAAGGFVAYDFEFGAERGTDAGRRVLATVAVTLMPNTYLCGFDPERGKVIIHQLVDTGESPLADDLRRPPR
jgi:multisubunit Na+/H+ antiporter MnhE subunit